VRGAEERSNSPKGPLAMTDKIMQNRAKEKKKKEKPYKRHKNDATTSGEQ